MQLEAIIPPYFESMTNHNHIHGLEAWGVRPAGDQECFLWIETG
jgi:hypothetical protein